MTNEENILDTLKSLIEDTFPTYIQLINEEYNDGILLDDLKEVVLFEGTKKLSYIVLSIKNGEYEEKDRIIDTEVYKVTVEFMLPINKIDGWRIESRYKKAFKLLIEDNSTIDEIWQWAKLRRSNTRKLELEVTV